MKLFSFERLSRGKMCTPAWISIIIREHPGYLQGYSLRIIIPWYNNAWSHEMISNSNKWCRVYPEIFFFGAGFIGERWFFNWVRAEDLGL